MTNQWNFFKRKKVSEKDEVPRKKKKTPDKPHVCLKCGSTLVRGRASYKERHWEQKHKDENPKLAYQFIIPSDHRDAKKIKTKKNIDKVTLNYDDLEERPVEKNLHEETSMTQKNNQSYLDQDQAKKQTDEEAMTKMQSDIKQIKLMLSTLTLQEKHANEIDLGNTSDTGIKNAKNLIEILHKDINIEVLEDGCKIICITCRRYIETKQVEIRRY